METIFEDIARVGVVPVVEIPSAEYAIPLADALIAGGLPVIEVTFRTAAAAEAIRILAKERPQLIVGAGTILDEATLKTAVEAGARFGVAPGLNPVTVKAAQESGLPFVPGIASASEIELGLSLGCKLLKFFPAEAAGGAKLLSAFSGPYRHTGVKFMPTGGVKLNNLADYISLPTVAAAGGTWLAKAVDMENGVWEEITERCRVAAAKVAEIRK